MALAACSTASGPTFSALELQSRGGVRTFQVDCHGLLSSQQICMKVAGKVCGDRPVRIVDSARALRDGSDPARVVFQCGAASAEQAPEATSASTTTVVEYANLMSDTLFPTGAARLTPAARATLDNLLDECKGRTYSQVEVTGYTDSVGGDASNLELSTRRARTVAAYLKTHGLNAQSVTVTGRGRADPIASNATAEGRARNRRVVILLQRGMQAT